MEQAGDKAAAAAAAVDNAKEAAGNAVDKAKEAAGNAVEKIKDAVPEGVKNALANISGGQQGLILMLLGATIAAFVLAGALYYIISRNIGTSSTTVLTETRQPVICTTLTKASGNDISGGSNGKRLSVTFWIYVNDMNVNMGQVRRVFNRGGKDSSAIYASNPMVLLNDKSNKLHVIFQSTEPSQFTLKGKDMSSSFEGQSTATKVEFLSAVHGVTIDYIPMQRWVHVGVVVNEEINGGTVYVYLDGELVKTVSSKQIIKLDGSTAPVPTVGLELQNLDLNSRGDIYIGGDASSIPGFSGLVSQVGFTNSDLNNTDIYKMYLRGPIDGGMGIAGYGIQSPIYRIG
jgi:hypothetical protein